MQITYKYPYTLNRIILYPTPYRALKGTSKYFLGRHRGGPEELKDALRPILLFASLLEAHVLGPEHGEPHPGLEGFFWGLGFRV